MLSRSRMRRLEESERFGIIFGILPLGTNRSVASLRTCLNKPSPVLQEIGGSMAAKRSSVWAVNSSHLAFRKLVKVRRGGSGQSMEKALPSWMIMGRWSELPVVEGDQSESIAMWGVAMERSGEEGFPEVGRRVCISELRRTRSASNSASWMASPLLAAEESVVEENQEGWWALKSPRMRVSSWVCVISS